MKNCQITSLLCDLLALQVFLKFIYSEKATNFCEISTVDLTYVVTVKSTKEYKEEGQCAQKGGRMLVFVICGYIKDFFPNFYFILQTYHVKSFKMMHITSL